MAKSTVNEISSLPSPGTRHGSVCVFDPSPLLTVTVEPSRSGDEIHLHPGGQGLWVARMARRLGAPARLVCALGGEAGRILAPLLAEDGIQVSAAHSANVNGTVVQDRRSGTRAVVARSVPAPLTRHEADDLYGSALAGAAEAGVLVLTGPNPQGVVPVEFYGRLTADVAALGVPIVADLSGDALTSALTGTIDVLKVSEEDLRRDGFLVGDDEHDVFALLATLHEQGADAVVITRSHRPSLAHVDGQIFAICGPALRAVDHRGAGDAMTAAISVEVSVGSPVVRALRWGAAAGAAAVTRRGLASGRKDEVKALFPHVTARLVEGIDADHAEACAQSAAPSSSVSSAACSQGAATGVTVA